MKRIMINPRYSVGINDRHPDDEDFPELSFLIDENHAVVTDGYCVSLVEIAPDEVKPGTYRMLGEEYISIGIDDERTIEGIARIVERLKSISAYELLTKHFNILDKTFFVNRESAFKDSYEEGKGSARVNEHGDTNGKDY